MSDRDYYEILGLTPRADGAMVDQAYWHLARKYQGLAATNARAQYMLDELNEAYGVLGNPRLREQYDAFRDDVLVRRGMIRPVRSKPSPKARVERNSGESRNRRQGVPWAAPRVPHLRVYGVATAGGALACAAAWAGLSIALVAPLTLAALAIAVSPMAMHRISAAKLNLSMPTMPTMPSMPSMQTPKLSMPSLSDTPFAGSKDDGPIDADQLRQSTAATIARWRKSVGLMHIDTSDLGGDGAPDTTLVDIVASERELDDTSEPLSAVLDILRGSRGPVNSR